MFRIDTSTNTNVLPTPAAPGTPGYFRTPPDPVQTVVSNDWANMVQEELISILTAGGVSPSKTTYNQVLTALQALFPLSADFLVSLTANGYLQFPNGLLLQWGGELVVPAGGNSVVNYPISFPNNTFQPFLTCSATTDSTTPISAGAEFISNSQLKIHNRTAVNLAISYLVIGN